MKFTLADMSARQLEQEELTEFLDQPNILRIAMIDFRDGWPVVHPVWYYYKDNMFFLAVDNEGVKAQSLRKNPNVYFLVDIDPDDGAPYGVRGKGTARVVDDPEYATKVTRHNILRYLGTLDSAVGQRLMQMGKSSSVIEITPSYIATWKF